MKLNMGKSDRMIRLAAAAVVLGLYFTNVVQGWLGILLLIFAFIFIATSFAGSCPIYSLLGLSSKPSEKKA